VAIASDRAFHFRYPEAEELLRAVGLEPRSWSPLADEPLPPDCGAVILPGGYPELHAAQLAASRRSLGGLRAAARAGLPILAECGGLLLLGQQLHDADDQPQPMAGLLPFSARRGGLSLGYRQAEAISDGLLVRRGELLVGHEFHRWQLLEADGGASADALQEAAVAANHRNEPVTAARRLWQLEGWGSPRRPEGWTTTHIHATWLHLHWAGCPVIPWRLAAASASAAPLPKSAASCIPRTPGPPT
jgi:cobyrinic acid a,c-diamide synthase